MKKETRREFMKTTLAGIGAAAIGPLVVPAGVYAGDSATTRKQGTTMQAIEYACDVAVVGGGPGGLAAALAAARQGAWIATATSAGTWPIASPSLDAWIGISDRWWADSRSSSSTGSRRWGDRWE